MDIYKFEQWCNRAVAEIVFPPDRKEVAEELLGHLCDRYDDLIAQGYDEDTACDRALAAMGDAEEIAPQLAAVHRPFWGYFLRATRILLVVLLLITVPLFGVFLYVSYDSYSQPPRGRYDPYEHAYLSDEVGVTTRVMYQEPQQQMQSDGYTWELTRAAWTHTQFADGIRELDSFDFQIEITNPWPWSWKWSNNPDIRDWLWAQDSEGTIYPPYEADLSDNRVNGNIYHTSPLTWTLDMWIGEFVSQDADWIDICYTRDGRDFRFRVDLPGGDIP